MLTLIIGIIGSVIATILCTIAGYVWKTKKMITIGPIVIARKSSLSQARFYKSNHAAVTEEITQYIKSHNIRKAVFIQYSCNNVTEVLQTLWAKDAVSIQLYLANPKSKRRFSDWQATWINRFLDSFENNFVLERRGHQTHMDLYLYDAPGSPRVIMLDEELIAFGCYFYEWQDKIPKPYGPQLDLRGAEKPLIIIHKDDPTFSIIHESINGMLENWKEHEKDDRILRFYGTHPKAEALHAPLPHA